MSWQQLLIQQYRDQPTAGKHIKTLETAHLDYLQTLDSLVNCLDIDTAQGYQLDLIASRLGLSRNINDYSKAVFFGFDGYEASGAFNLSQWLAFNSKRFNSTQVDDDTLRRLIRVKVTIINSSGTWPDVVNWFKALTMSDNFKVRRNSTNKGVEILPAFELDYFTTYILERRPDLVLRAVGIPLNIAPPLGLNVALV